MFDLLLLSNVTSYIFLSDEDRSRERDSRSSGRNTPSNKFARDSRSLEAAVDLNSSADNLGRFRRHWISVNLVLFTCIIDKTA